LLAALTLFSAGCATSQAAATAEIDSAIDALAPETPPPPVLEAVAFEDRDGGLWLSYENYRALERNIIAMREYEARMVLVIEYYRGGK
jgi:hypothetical protein